MPVVVAWWWWWYPGAVVVVGWWWRWCNRGGGIGMVVVAVSAWDDDCRGRNLIRAAFRDAADDHKHDPWGSGMMALGVLTDAATWLGEPFVDATIMTPGAGQVEGGEWIQYDEFESARELTVAIREGQASTEDLDYGIRVIDRYLDLPAVNARRY